MCVFVLIIWFGGQYEGLVFDYQMYLPGGLILVFNFHYQSKPTVFVCVHMKMTEEMVCVCFLSAWFES